MNLAAAAQSSIGRKLISGFTGLLLVGFVVGHLTGNFLLLAGPEAFNDYAYFLEHMFHGAGLIVAEIGLIVLFAAHAWSGYTVWANKARARKSSYEVSGDAGGASKKSLSSTSMLWTGCLLLAFVIWHVLQFKFGVVDPHSSQRLVEVGGVQMRDLYGLVVDTFASPLWTIAYLVIMTALGVHLWHGCWSAFQSLGLTNGKYLSSLTQAAHLVAVVLALGFLFLPAYILVRNDAFQQADQEYMRQYQVDGDASNTKMSGAFPVTAGMRA